MKYPFVNPLDPEMKAYIWYEKSMMQNKINNQNYQIAKAQRDLKEKMEQGNQYRI